jgi:hypothetical protein
MWEDPIVEEVRRVRGEHAAAHGFDLRRIYDDLKSKEAVSGREVIVLPPKPVRPRRRLAGTGEPRNATHD